MYAPYGDSIFIIDEKKNEKSGKVEKVLRQQFVRLGAVRGDFVAVVDPTYVVYSRGCNNKYGHPSQETIDTFAQLKIPTLDTCTRGTISFVSDGKTVQLR